MDELKNFLMQIGRMVELNAEKRKEKEERGELFNVFEVLNLQYNETRTHSAFLAALLNEKIWGVEIVSCVHISVWWTA